MREIPKQPRYAIKQKLGYAIARLERAAGHVSDVKGIYDQQHPELAGFLAEALDGLAMVRDMLASFRDEI